jgi:hypothetical protein
MLMKTKKLTKSKQSLCPKKIILKKELKDMNVQNTVLSLDLYNLLHKYLCSSMSLIIQQLVFELINLLSFVTLFASPMKLV